MRPVELLQKKLINSLVLSVAKVLGRRRLAAGKPKTLWSSTPILTLPLKARADRRLGFISHSLVFTTYYISQNFDYNLQKLAAAANKVGPRFGRAFELGLLAWAMWRYDVFHFFFDRGLTGHSTRFGVRLDELDLLKAAGKRVYLYAYGADVRTRQATLALGRWNFCVDCSDIGKHCVCDEETGARHMAEMCKRVTAAIALGDMIAYPVGVRNMHYWPIDTEAVAVSATPRAEGPLRIAHAPNHTHFKGTRYLEAAIERLRAQGHAIDYVKVQGVSNAEVIQLFGEADLIADQLIGGAYGYTALEGMARGKPVLTYVRSRALVEAPDECPLLNATPDDVEGVLRWVLENRAALAAIGLQGRAYVERRHSIPAVAARLGSLYLDTADFPEHVNARLRAVIDGERRRVESVKLVEGWQHPWVVA